MTAHIIMTSFVLLVFLFVQLEIYKNRLSILRQGILNIVIIYILLPFTIPFVAVIADFIFEGFKDNLTWFAFFAILAWLASTFYVWKNIMNKCAKIQKVWAVSVVLVLFPACIYALLTSHHESSNTTKLTDWGYLTGYFIGIHLTLIMTFALQITLLIQSSRRSISVCILGNLTILAIIAYIVSLYNL